MLLTQIQKENRRKIICAVHNTEDYAEAVSKELERNTRVGIGILCLSRVLLAIRQKGYFDDIYFGDLTETLEFDKKDLSWDLTKETLEEQSEKCQRAINELLK